MVGLEAKRSINRLKKAVRVSSKHFSKLLASRDIIFVQMAVFLEANTLAVRQEKLYFARYIAWVNNVDVLMVVSAISALRNNPRHCQ